MLKQHSDFLKSVIFLCDLVVICASWVAAYYIRFSVALAPITKGIPPIAPYLWVLVPIIAVWAISFQAFNLYRPRRMGSHLAEFWDLAKASTLSVLFLLALTFFFREFEYSRLVVLCFWVLNLFSLGFSRMVFREGLRFLRRRGYNQRHVLIIGAGKLGQSVVESLLCHPEFGLTIRGYLSRDHEKVGKEFKGVPVVGTYADVKEMVASGIDIVFLCLPTNIQEQAKEILGYLATTMVEIKVVLAIDENIKLRAEAEMFEGLPLITFQGSPLYGWNVVLKRGVDIVGAAAAIVLMSPMLLVIAALVKLSSSGPILYRQIRMGLDGHTFEMHKFRTMRADAESKTGPVWATANDTRRTRFGAFLRRTSLDELPQFFDVLKGEMSIVGPRPERPEFIMQFRERFSHYLLRHKMKAGITGWAQVNGWRGNTSLEKRLEFDLYYIENWSIWFDLKIMLQTIWKGFIHKDAY